MCSSPIRGKQSKRETEGPGNKPRRAVKGDPGKQLLHQPNEPSVSTRWRRRMDGQEFLLERIGGMRKGWKRCDVIEMMGKKRKVNMKAIT